MAEPGAGRLRPRRGWRHRLRKAWTAAAAPPRCPHPPRLRGRAPLSAASAALGFIFLRSHIVLCSAGSPIGPAAPRPPSRLRHRHPNQRPARPGPSRPGRAEGEGGKGEGGPWLGRRGGSGSVLLATARAVFGWRSPLPQPGAADKWVCRRFWAALPLCVKDA